jgi:hypothetical protein
MIDSSIELNLTALFRQRQQANGVSDALLVRLTPLSSDTLRARWKTSSGWKLSEVLAMCEALSIDIGELNRVLFPSEESNIQADLERLSREVKYLRSQNDELREGRFEPHAVMIEILRTGLFSVSAIPMMAGPNKDVLIAVRIAAAPLTPIAAKDESETAPAAILEKLHSHARLALQKALVLSTAPGRRPSLPGIRGEEAPAFVDLSIPLYEENREQLHPESLHYQGTGVLILATSTGAHAGNVAAIVARALGWSLTSSRELARRQQSDFAGRKLDRVLLRRKSEQELRSWLNRSDRDPNSVMSHWGVADEIDGAISHPVISAIEDRQSDPSFPQLPFIVLLNEAQGLLDYYGKLPFQGTQAPTMATTAGAERRGRTRDALFAALPKDHQSRLNLPVRPLTSEDPEQRDLEAWARSADLAKDILRKLLKGKHLYVEDRETRKLLGLPSDGLFS